MWRMLCACATLSSLAFPTLQYISTLSHKRQDFRNQVTEHKMRVLIFSTTSVWNISHSKNNWATYYQKSILVFPLRLSILMELEFSRQVSEKFSNIKFHKNPFRGSTVNPFGRTDGTKLIVLFAILRMCLRNIIISKVCTSFYHNKTFYTQYVPQNGSQIVNRRVMPSGKWRRAVWWKFRDLHPEEGGSSFLGNVCKYLP